MASVSKRQLSERQRLSSYDWMWREYGERFSNRAKRRTALAPSNGVITPFAQAAIDEILVNRIGIMSAAKAVDQSSGHTRGTTPSGPDRGGGPRSADNRSSGSTGGCADGRPRTATHRRPFQCLSGAPTRSHEIFRHAHAIADIAIGDPASNLPQMSIWIKHWPLRAAANYYREHRAKTYY